MEKELTTYEMFYILSSTFTVIILLSFMTTLLGKHYYPCITNMKTGA